MKTEKAIKKLEKMLNIKEDSNTETSGYKPSIKKLKAYTAEFDSSLSDSFCTGTEWVNGEGFDLVFTDSKNKDKFVSLHIDELELLLLLLHKFNYFKK